MSDEPQSGPLPFPARHDPAMEQDVTLPDVREDAELNALLKRWTAPPVSELLDARVLASYRSLVRRRRWWRRVVEPLRGDIGWRGKRRRWRTPAAFAGMVALVAIGFVLRGPQPLSASELLQVARQSEGRARVATDEVLHRVLSLEERTLPDNVVTSRRRVEVWSSPAKGLTVRRVFDEDGRVLEGEWVTVDGFRTRYRRGVQPQTVPPRNASDADEFGRVLASGRRWDTSGIDDVTRMDPSATSFSAVIGHPDLATVRETATTFIVMSRPEGRALTSAALTLTKPDLQAVALTLRVQRPDREREYRFAQSRIERVALEAQPEALFRPDAELLDVSVPSSAVRSSFVSKSRPVPAVTPNTVYVEALRLLHQAGACLSEQGRVFRASDGALQIEAIVQSEARKDQLQQALRPVLRWVAERFAITNTADALHERVREADTSLIVRELDVTQGRIPVYEQVRRHLASMRAQEPAGASPVGEGGGARDRVDADVRAFANDMLTGSRTLLQHAWALRNLTDVFPQEQVERLTADARTTWYSMIRDHARALQQETERLRARLEPVFFAERSVTDAGIEPESREPRDLTDLVAQLFELSSADERTIRSVFVIAEHPQNAMVISSATFHDVLRRTEILAAQIQSRRP